MAPRDLPDRVVLLGIRHHGPGSARMVAAALAAVRPEVVLIEGPPEGDALLEHLPSLVPPVALLLHDEAEPSAAAFWPFAEFSPEWRALTWAHANAVPVRFFDLPAAASLGAEPSERRAVVDPLGVVGDGGYAAFEAELFRRLPVSTVARLTELEALEEKRPLTTAEVLEAMELAWPGYFSSLEVAQPIPQTGHAPSDQSWASIREQRPILAQLLPGCTVPTRFVHGDLDPLPVSASTDNAAELMGAVVDVLPGNGHFPWLEDPGCVRRSLDMLLGTGN